jgi:RNA polymerase sigma-70 factor (ECF subfamily)
VTEVSFERQVCDQIPHLRRYARALCGDVSAADDLVQDCLERALRKRYLWQPGGRLRAWLFRILYRTYLNDRASARARREVTTPDAGASLTEFPAQEAHVQCHDVLAVVDELPPEQRDALLLMALEGPSYREAARIFEINVGTLRSRLARARETVRQRCGREPSADERRLRRVK